ncbi:MAG: hypothetical protein OXF86_01275 [Caldilineaceae bacterium]|nr:hypothetical protein [Caldilineaceae bacterium]
MKRPTPLKRTRRIALPLALALLLSLALTAVAFAQPPTNPGQPIGGPSGDPGVNNPGEPTNNPGEPSSNPSPGPSGDPPAGTTETIHPGAPFTPPANCIVAHAATPAQLCPVGGGLQYYFIGPGGTSSGGPWIASFAELAGHYAAGGGVSLYSGSNPFTGKSVDITYLPSEQKLRISTYYPDNQYDVNKPYVFTVDTSNNIKHEAW